MKVSYEKLIRIMTDAGWSIQDFEDERSRQFYEALDKRLSEIPPPFFPEVIFMEGDEPDDPEPL